MPENAVDCHTATVRQWQVESKMQCQDSKGHNFLKFGKFKSGSVQPLSLHTCLIHG
jgi:hypothetical protein